MNLILVNKTQTDLPVMSKDEGGWCETLTAGGTMTVPYVNSDVIIVGDKPDVTDVVKKTVEVAGKLAKKLKDWMAGQTNPKKGDPSQTTSMTVEVMNDGPQPIRVILGDGVTDHEIAPGVTYIAIAPGYIEIRELGDAPQQAGTPD